MTLLSILLITISVFAHVLWNLLSKQQNPSGAFFLLATTAAVLCLLPGFWIFRGGFFHISPLVWFFVTVTGCFQAIYYIGLAEAYRRGDMSLAYPLVRAIPVLLITACNFVFGRGAQIGPLGLTGILVVAFGCLVLPMRDFSSLNPRNYLSKCYLFSVFAAIGTCGYTMVDDEALRQLRQALHPGFSTTQTTLFYILLQTFSTWLALLLFVISRRTQRQQLQRVWSQGKGQAAASGIIITSAYGLVLASMAYVSNVSYVAAFRQLSIPLGAAIAVFVFREPAYLPKLLGIVIVFSGLILVALG
jgi:drug/metabolite transporter (DMT)-like permease